MAYALRYWYETRHDDGKVVRLEIYKKDSTASPIEIGDVVQGLSLNIEGGENNLDSPVVSTSLVLTVVDAYDHPDSDIKKCGNWAEFYTPDATLWKIILLSKDAEASEFKAIWGGYVTPDSYQEEIDYRGSITIVARDNINHMADFPFDYQYATASFKQLIEAAWAKIESPMTLTWSENWLKCEDEPANMSVLNSVAFTDKNWGEVVNDVLLSYCAVLRYVGGNEVHVCPLRYMVDFGTQSVSQSTPTFEYGATRMLTPAVKRIEEEAKYDIQSGEQLEQIRTSGFSSVAGTYKCQIDGVSINGTSFGTVLHDAPISAFNLLGSQWLGAPVETSLYFNPHAYEVGYFSKREGQEQEIMRYMYLAANNMETRRVTFIRKIFSQDFVLKLQLGTPISLNKSYQIEQVSVFGLKRITYSVGLIQNGITEYYNGGGWQASEARLTKEYDPLNFTSSIELPISVGDIVGEAELRFTIWGILYMQTGYSRGQYGLYACIQDFTISNAGSKSLLSVNRVNTNYDEQNNVIISRDPKLAPAFNTVVASSIIKNGIFVRSGWALVPAPGWAWDGGTPQQMAVYNHLQILCFYSKPNNILEGTILNGDVTNIAHIWEWEDCEHILVAGSFNMLTGHIDGAILREFARYENLWSDVLGASMPDIEEDSSSNMDGATSSSSPFSTYEQSTSVNINIGGGGGASYLSDLMDVDTTNATDGSVLYYDGEKWVDRGFAALIASVTNALNAIKDWFTLEDDVLHTRYNIATDQEISARGLNKEDGEGDGGLISTVYGADQLGTIETEDSSETFNAYAIDSIYKMASEKYSKPSEGIPASDLAPEVHSSLDKVDSAIQNVKTINGESIVGEGNIEIGVDTSTLATKEELAEVEEVTAAALNELDDRKADKEYVEDALAKSVITKEELESKVDDVNNTIIDNEEILASAINELNSRIAVLESIISTLNNN